MSIINTVTTREVVEVRHTVLEDTVMVRSWHLQPNADGDVEHDMLADLRLDVDQADELIVALQAAVAKLRQRAAHDPRPVRQRYYVDAGTTTIRYRSTTATP